MRVYLPVTLTGLAAARAAACFDGTAGDGLPGHAVTPTVREWYTEGDLEELEYSAMLDAAEHSLELLHRDGSAPRRRVVVSVDVPDGAVRPGGRFRSSVLVTAEVPLAWVASVHVDEPEAEGTIAAAVDAVPAALDGDDDARFLLDEAEACDLLWYDVSELDELVKGTGSG